MDDERIILDWQDVNHESGRWADRWHYNLALYSILHPDEDEILYLGKADGCTVRSRWNADDKHERVWSRIEDERDIFEHGFIVGEFRLPDGQRLSRQLVCDVESFLIHQIKPWANSRKAALKHCFIAKPCAEGMLDVIDANVGCAGVGFEDN
jgi:hypothetical protein